MKRWLTAVWLVLVLSVGAQDFGYSIPKTGSQITIDGKLDDWNILLPVANPPFYIPKGSGTNGTLVTFEPYDPPGSTNTSLWVGPEDHSFTFSALYDDLNVYFGIVVKDDYHENSKASAWSGDSLQMVVANLDRTFLTNRFNCALPGVEGALSNSLVVMYTGYSNTNISSVSNSIPTVAIVRNATAKTTTYEIKFPRITLLVPIWEASRAFNLGVCVNDSDRLAVGQRGWSGIGPHSIVFGTSPEYTKTFILQDPTWNPIQYYLKWDNVPGSLYYISLRSTAINNTNNVTDFSSWSTNKFRNLEDSTNVCWMFQGTGNARTQFFVTASNTTTGTLKYSNKVGWPTNFMNTPPTNDFELKLVRTPVGPPMYFNSNPPLRPTNTRRTP
jgi:hypothetical protein